jgi:hypothetical protein
VEDNALDLLEQVISFYFVWLYILQTRFLVRGESHEKGWDFKR